MPRTLIQDDQKTYTCPAGRCHSIEPRFTCAHRAAEAGTIVFLALHGGPNAAGVAVDLDALTLATPVPLLRDHDERQRAGEVTRLWREAGVVLGEATVTDVVAWDEIRALDLTGVSARLNLAGTAITEVSLTRSPAFSAARILHAKNAQGTVAIARPWFRAQLRQQRRMLHTLGRF